MNEILIRHVLRTAALFVPIAIAIAFFAFGESVALGTIVGATLALINMVGLVWVIGKLLDPKTTVGKPLLYILLCGKLLLVAGLFWISLAILKISGEGTLIGIGAAISSVVLGLNRGSMSAEGQAAMNAEEARIKQELGDNDTKSS